MNLRKSLVFQIKHHIIYNMKKEDRVFLKHIRNSDQKNQALMVMLYYYWVSLELHFDSYLRFVVNINEDDIQLNPRN